MIPLLADAVWPSIPSSPLVLVPVGSTEQHGPHLPFDTDAVIATATATGIAHLLAGDSDPVLVAPTLAYGSSGEHQDFAGTASIGRDALRMVVVELVRSLSTWAGRIVLVNGHGGNVSTLSSAVPQLLGERHDVAWIPCATPGGDAHAGRSETSLLLAIAPERVRLEAAVAGVTDSMPTLFERLTRVGVRAVSPSGVLGDPAGANAEEGARLLEAMIASGLRRIRTAQVDAGGRLRDPGGTP
ncbi:MAG: mycofactocin biosynthesis peptidyl-dipeptidase MftE [Galbitalea sp.]